MRVAVVDIGTNSVRLLVADGEGRRLRDIVRELTITRLGEGVDRDRRLKARAVSRTLEAVTAFVERAREEDAERMRIIATSAVRDAANRHAFLHGVRAGTGIEVDLLTGDEEAMMGFEGATLEMPVAGPYIVCDIGGGSTELVAGTERAERFISLDIGAVRLTERHIRSDPPTTEEIEACRADARVEVERARATVGDASASTLVGLAGTITTVAALALGLSGYDREAIHHAELGSDQVGAIGSRLQEMTSAERRILPAMPPGREDVIVAGVVILEEIFRSLGARRCLVSETDILDGCAVSLLRDLPSARL